MRIEKVLIHNINSLAGTFEIDFTQSDYAEGLFAIVGPSGAGKSTIFDAICLALYGKTPRINMISETQNEIMTKAESECGAEVTFWSRGKKYKAVFSHARAKGQNPFRQVKREVIEYGQDGTGSIIASMIKEVNAKITEITGLDYNQFRRSIMLAQFEFTEFLKADSNTRAGILEQISDMDIYRNISIAVYQRAKKHEAGLFEIRTKIDAVNVLDDVRQKELENEAKQLGGAIAEYSELGERFVFCAESIKKAAELQESLEVYEKEKKRLEQELLEQNKKFETAKINEQKTKQQQSDLQKTLKTVRELDNKIAVEKNNIKRIESEIDGDEKKIREYKSVILNLFKKYLPGADNAKLKSLYETHDAADIIRAEAKADLKGATDKEKNMRGKIEKTLAGKDEKYWQARADLLEIALPIAQSQRAVLLSEIRQSELYKKAEKLEEKEKEQKAKNEEMQEKLLLARLEEKFGQERSKLEDGKPCPLCGALHHPGIDAEQAEKNLQYINEQKTLLLKEIEKTKRDIIDIKSSLAAEDKLVKEKTAVINENKVRLAGIGARLEDTGVDFIDDTAEKKIEELIDEAKVIMRKYSELLKEHSAASGEVSRFTRQLGEVDKDVLIIDNNKQTIKDTQLRNEKRQEAKEKAQKELGKNVQERIKIFGQRQADKEEQMAEKLLEEAQKVLEECREKSQKAKSDAQQNINDIERTKKEIEKQNIKLGQAYKQAVENADKMCSEPVFGDDEIRGLFADICDLSQKVSKDAGRNIGDINSMANALRALSAKQTERKGRVAEQLETNDQRKKQLKDLRSQEKQLKKAYEKWSRLNALIGSATGDKFSRMAQGITFEVLLQYANANLMKMSDRYLLMRDSGNIAKPLEISVLDNYQAGDIRPVSNLSGGESFIVSMALALGLSEMSSNKTRIDSLFIDEGFASLDEDYLEAALQTLSSLGNRENKLVGVISHVGALKERINVKVQVDKLSGGKSTLSGPGVTVG